MFKYFHTVAGYELDSFGHVNNAVYLNYLEQARWDILKKSDLLGYFKKKQLKTYPDFIGVSDKGQWFSVNCS